MTGIAESSEEEKVPGWSRIGVSGAEKKKLPIIKVLFQNNDFVSVVENNAMTPCGNVRTFSNPSWRAHPSASGVFALEGAEILNAILFLKQG
ncbi:unnamed protein product [Bursaphelenchus xylophilus]|uniref:(pine wood nematode) hypothetical protein n=1 Tax=Bursaphelenchus xylophilus TaxID=6326 RepID=A0A7I8WJX9_BURXY|nr:unnamed protein product [Bursaphelenchus xylophilus]CAG9107434.1 unnamed protein product [Bursaphelenchus xylophilus]